MPKNGRDFPCTINLGVDLETKQGVIAMGYLSGQGGEYASVVRNLVKRGLRRWVESLGEKERKEYDEILANVRIQVTK